MTDQNVHKNLSMVNLNLFCNAGRLAVFGFNLVVFLTWRLNNNNMSADINWILTMEYVSGTVLNALCIISSLTFIADFTGDHRYPHFIEEESALEKFVCHTAYKVTKLGLKLRLLLRWYSALLLAIIIPLLLCSSHSLSGKYFSVTGHLISCAHVWHHYQLVNHLKSWTLSHSHCLENSAFQIVEA